MALNVETIVTGSFQENCYLLWDDETMTGALVDPGDEPDRILEIARKRGIILEAVGIPDGHIDHAGAVSAICTSLNIPFSIHSGEKELLEALPAQARMFGLRLQVAIPQVTHWLDDNSEIRVGNQLGKVLFTPGHTPGGVCFLFDRIVFVGDTLFSGSIGRTDLPGGDGQLLIHSIKSRLLCLDDHTEVYSGHGPSTRISVERLHNPFLSGRWQLQIE